MYKRLLMLTCMAVALSLVSASVVSGHVLEIRIGDDNDGAEQHLIENPRMDLGSSDLEIPYEDGGAPPTDPQAIGVRFVVGIGPGTALTSAHLELQADKANKEGTLEPVNAIIRRA